MPFATTVIKETKSFAKEFDKQVGSSQRDVLHRYLIENPKAGVLLKGGLRKIRWAKHGGGKSGGVRIIYYFWHAEKPIYLLTLFAKNEKENISGAELKELIALSNKIKKIEGDVK